MSNTLHDVLGKHTVEYRLNAAEHAALRITADVATQLTQYSEWNQHDYFRQE